MSLSIITKYNIENRNILLFKMAINGQRDKEITPLMFTLTPLILILIPAIFILNVIFILTPLIYILTLLTFILIYYYTYILTLQGGGVKKLINLF